MLRDDDREQRFLERIGLALQRTEAVAEQIEILRGERDEAAVGQAGGEIVIVVAVADDRVGRPALRARAGRRPPAAARPASDSSAPAARRRQTRPGRHPARLRSRSSSSLRSSCAFADAAAAAAGRTGRSLRWQSIRGTARWSCGKSSGKSVSSLAKNCFRTLGAVQQQLLDCGRRFRAIGRRCRASGIRQFCQELAGSPDAASVCAGRNAVQKCLQCSRLNRMPRAPSPLSTKSNGGDGLNPFDQPPGARPRFRTSSSFGVVSRPGAPPVPGGTTSSGPSRRFDHELAAGRSSRPAPRRRIAPTVQTRCGRSVPAKHFAANRNSR